MGELGTLLSPWQWAIMAALPVLLVLLYFLKLKRHPVEVPSTYLWKKSIEDLHVNSIWQRLRRNLLLFLQLLVLLLAILALLIPYWGEGTTSGERYIFLIDNSASMSADDVTPSRLAAAKAQVNKFLDEQKRSQDAVMIISFSDTARIVQEFTTSAAECQAALARIPPTTRRTSINDALSYAAGLANTPRASYDPEDEQAPEPLPAKLWILSDGNFTPPSFSLGNLEASYVPLGKDNVDNLAIVAFSASRPDERSQQLQIFGRIENHGREDRTALAQLYVNDQPVDVQQVEVPAGKSAGVVFTQQQLETAVLEMRLDGNDALDADNAAWAVINPPQRGKVLLVTAGNRPLEFALQTPRAQAIADLLIESPQFLQTEEYRQAALSGLFDLIIFDRCLPEPSAGSTDAPTPMPQSNCWFIGLPPKLEEWGWKPGTPWPASQVVGPQIIDLERAHPIMQLLDVERLLIAQAAVLTPPSGSVTLMDALALREVEGNGEPQRVQVPVFAIAPRRGFEDAVLSFDIITDEQNANTDWIKRRSFPVMVLNVLQYLAGGPSEGGADSLRPGQPIELQVATAGETLTVATPAGREITVQRSPGNVFRFLDTDELGVYHVQSNGDTVERFAVNLFDSQESNLKPRPELDFDWNKVQATADTRPQPRAGWKILLLLALFVLLIEWYIYNRRVYL